MLVAHMVTKNEAGRYLASCLSWLVGVVDRIHIFDDQSDDGTVDIAVDAGATVNCRSDDQPSFMEGEGLFRAAAWEALGEVARGGDWILCLDADEFLTSVVPQGVRERLLHLAKSGRSSNYTFNVREVFDLTDDGKPLVRNDGYWGRITATRFCQWSDRNKFAREGLGCGAIPEQDAPTYRDDSLDILHYGYLLEADRRAKYDRYKGRSGHNEKHIDSILATPHTFIYEFPHPSLP